jgi:hypothetical protein
LLVRKECAKNSYEKISFLKFMAYGIPVTFLSLVVATLYLLLRNCPKSLEGVPEVALQGTESAPSGPFHCCVLAKLALGVSLEVLFGELQKGYSRRVS